MYRENAGSRGSTRQAFITDACTGCGGAPVCVIFCRYGALELVLDDEHYPMKKMKVDSLQCKGCGLCVTGGENGLRLTGCPWDAIQMKRIYKG